MFFYFFDNGFSCIWLFMEDNCFQAQLLNKSRNTCFAIIITAMNDKYLPVIYFFI